MLRCKCPRLEAWHMQRMMVAMLLGSRWPILLMVIAMPAMWWNAAVRCVGCSRWLGHNLQSWLSTHVLCHLLKLKSQLHEIIVYICMFVVLINVLHGIYVDAHASCAWLSKDIYFQ